MNEEQFTLKNDRDAAWAMGKIQQAEKDKAEWKAFYKEQADKACAEFDQTIERMKYYLQQYFNEQPETRLKRTKTQTKMVFPCGELVYKPASASYKQDDEALLAFVKGDPVLCRDYIKVTEKADWAGLKKISEDMDIMDTDPVTGEQYTRTVRVLKDTGEILPVEVTKTDVFTVSVKGDTENE